MKIKEKSVSHIIPSPRMTNLINGMGKCLAISLDSSRSCSNLIQWDCNQHQKGMLWYVEIGICATFSENVLPRLKIPLPIRTSFNGITSVKKVKYFNFLVRQPVLDSLRSKMITESALKYVRIRNAAEL